MVYVDDYLHPFGQMKMSHMIADTEDELHAMAAKINLARRHYQGDHYDVCMEKRRLAFKAGAVSIDVKQAAAMRANRRAAILAGSSNPSLGDPATAIFEFQTRLQIARRRSLRRAAHG